jgi:hypothetical protein
MASIYKIATFKREDRIALVIPPWTPEGDQDHPNPVEIDLGLSNLFVVR